VHPFQLKLWSWIADYYMCSEGEVMAAALPAHFKLSSETVLVFNDEFGDDFSSLDNEEYLVAEALLMKHELRLTEVQQILDVTHVYPIVNRLIGKKVCFVWESLKQTYAAKKETFVLLDPVYGDEDKLADLLNNWSRAPKQMELLLSYLHLARTEGEVTKTELLKKSNASDAQLKGLVDKEILRTERRAIDRLHSLPKDVQVDFSLSEAQETALAAVRASLDVKPVCLLHGVTSSGKTLVYMKLIEEQIRHGKQVLYMLPEIALTAQIIRRLQKHFGGFIGIYHSRFNHNERVEIWNKVRSGEMKVVLGAPARRCFMPYQDLGLIICDEEHDSSYKQQDPAPRYHGRDAAIYLASNDRRESAARHVRRLHWKPITTHRPDKFGLVELLERFGDVKLPNIDLVDLRAIPKKPGEKVMFSMQLLEEIKATIARGKQIILFQNRRGYAPRTTMHGLWLDRAVQTLRHVSLTYHKFSNKLKCHYCGNISVRALPAWPAAAISWCQRSFGTERIEEVLEERPCRM
jgi:primosomal protein N' (replication factor Y)